MRYDSYRLLIKLHYHCFTECCLLTESHSALAHFVTGFCSLLDSIPVCPGGSIRSCLLSASNFDRLAEKIKKMVKQLKDLKQSPARVLHSTSFVMYTTVILSIFSILSLLEQRQACFTREHNWELQRTVGQCAVIVI